MFWIANGKGGLVNLALATDVKVVDVHKTHDGRNTYEVRAYFDGSGDVPGITGLFKGTRDECYGYLDALVNELRCYYGDHGPFFHDIVYPPPAKPESQPDDVPF